MRAGVSMMCNSLGCSNTVPCADHPHIRSDRSPISQQSGLLYKTARWVRFRLWFLGLDPADNPGIYCGPLCWNCKDHGRVESAVDIDHIVPRSAGGDDWDMHNMRSLCKSCHSTKTAREQGAFGRTING